MRLNGNIASIAYCKMQYSKNVSKKVALWLAYLTLFVMKGSLINSFIFPPDRKLHEKGLLAKLSTIEDKLQGHMNNMNKAVDDVKAGKEDVKVPTLDIDAVSSFTLFSPLSLSSLFPLTFFSRSFSFPFSFLSLSLF